jgi:glutaminyl-peptide cyclotransferase
MSKARACAQIGPAMLRRMGQGSRQAQHVPVRALVILLAVQVVIGLGLVVWGTQGFPLPGTDREEPGTAAGAVGLAPIPTIDRFDGARAFRLLREQVLQYGPRPAGSDASRRLAERLRSLLPRGRFQAIPGWPRLRNVVGRIPGRLPAIVIGAHYDTESVVPGHVGANDGAAGTAAVVQLARDLARVNRGSNPRELRFVLFDGEEEPEPTNDFYRDGLRGSKAYVAREGAEVRELILLDYIAERRNLLFTREAGSDQVLWDALRAAARRVGVGRLFSGRRSGQILDDHTPFTEQGIPAIDLIDFDYPQRDSLRDDLSAVSECSLDAVGEAVLELVRTRR